MAFVQPAHTGCLRVFYTTPPKSDSSRLVGIQFDCHRSGSVCETQSATPGYSQSPTAGRVCRLAVVWCSAYTYPMLPSFTQRPYIMRKCYFCGRGVKIRTTDKLLLETLPNGRSYNFCSLHWNKLRAHASPDQIESYRKRLPVYSADITGAIKYLRVTGAQLRP